PSPASNNVISSWTYSLDVPQTGDENVRINLWLFNGAAPTDNQEVEIVIKSFTFAPLSPQQPALLMNFIRSALGDIRFDLEGESDVVTNFPPRQTCKAGKPLARFWPQTR